MKKIIKKRFSRFIPIIIVVVVIGLIFGLYFIFRSPYKFRGNGTIKIIWLNSYHSDFSLLTDNIKAFKNVFEEKNIKIEIKEFDLNRIREPSPEYKNYMRQEEVDRLIDEYNPDLIYATDDSAQEIVSKYINTKIPIVFSNVNDNPETYGYDKAKNVAGVLEREHFIETINFLKDLYPDKIKTIGVISHDLSQWKVVMERAMEQTINFPEIKFIGWDRVHTFNEYKNKILEYQNAGVDAIVNFGLVGLIDENYMSVPETQVMDWLVKNSNVPDVTFWGFMVENGALLSVEVSAQEQGEIAGNFAKQILIDGKFPKNFEFKSTEKGARFLNLTRARSLGLKQENIPSLILINTKIINGI